MMYRLHGTDETSRIISTAVRIIDGLQFPFAPANSDYQKFKVDVADGVELQDPDGNVMTQEQADDFLKTIP